MYERILTWKRRQESEEEKRRTQEEKTEAHLQAVNDSAHHVRNFYITFLLLALYVSVIVWSTTDEMLLRISPVTLPMLNLQLPIKGFYTFAPYLLLLAHFNLLLQLYLLSDKLHQFNRTIQALPEDKQRLHFQSRLFPFPFAQLLSANYQRGWSRVLLVVMVWLLIIFLPPCVLVLLQLGFLPFHDATILWAQRCAIAADLLLLWIFWPMIQSTDGKLGRWYGQASELACIFRWLRSKAGKNVTSATAVCSGRPYFEALILTAVTVLLLGFSPYAPT